MFLLRSTAFLDYGFTPYTALLYLRTEEKVRTSCVPIVSAFTNSLFHQVSFFLLLLLLLLFFTNFLRSYPGALTSNASKKSSLCCCTAQNFVCGSRISRLEFKKGIQCWRAFSGSIANYADKSHEGETGEDVPKATLIWRAVKLPIYSVALVPLTVSFSL
jgi:hypothetical protein